MINLDKIILATDEVLKDIKAKNGKITVIFI